MTTHADTANASRTGLASGAGNLNPPGVAFWALFWHRFGNWRMAVRPKALRAPMSILYRVMFKACEIFCGISLPYNVRVGRRVCLEHFGGIILVPAAIGSDVTLRQNTTLGIPAVNALSARPIIEDHVDIGAGAVILGDITIGRGAVIGANAVVTKSVPPLAVMGGVPARLIRMRDPGELPGPDNAAPPT
jgi:serine O-acetyltransferase